MTTAIEPREPGAQRVDPSRVQVVGLEHKEFLKGLFREIREKYGRRGPSEMMRECGESIMAGFAEGVARANAIDVDPIGESECKPQYALMVRK